jgi:hypothetical protein
LGIGGNEVWRIQEPDCVAECLSPTPPDGQSYAVTLGEEVKVSEIEAE